MFDQVELDREFFAALGRVDAKIAGAVRDDGCGRCGGLSAGIEKRGNLSRPS
ncbi:MAG: hypothetical protein IPG04_37820 [Polyangiaceae bacterium]|nr:hypothetical protein [Polyangiaceae bacterium]